jgi:hypothetical protein
MQRETATRLKRTPFVFNPTHNEQGRGVGPPGHLRAVVNSSRTGFRNQRRQFFANYRMHRPPSPFLPQEEQGPKATHLCLQPIFAFFAPAADNGTHHTPYHPLTARARKTKPSGRLFPSATHISLLPSAFRLQSFFPTPIQLQLNAYCGAVGSKSEDLFRFPPEKGSKGRLIGWLSSGRAVSFGGISIRHCLSRSGG